MRCAVSVLFTTMLVAIATSSPQFVAAQVREVNPTCWSTTDDYITEELTVPIQPQTPVTVKRFQGPQLKLYCISFDEEGPSCTGATTKGTPQLCSRPVSSSGSAYSCENLVGFQADPNSRITRGSINGPEMIWLLRWDGTQQALSCYPKVVTARLLIYVPDTKVDSTAVLVIMCILVAICVILMIIAFYSFLANRYAVIDAAGATTIGGPGITYRGPQMQVASSSGVVNHTRVLLPVRDGDVGTNDLRASKFGQMTTVDENMTTEQILMPTVKRTQRASPPRPGDGVRDGMFPDPESRRRDGDFSDYEGEDYYDDESGYTSAGGRGGGRGRRGPGGGRGGGGRGRRAGRGDGRSIRNSGRSGRSGGGGGDGDSKYESTGADFPTQSNVETAGGPGFDGYDGDGVPLPQGMDGRVKQVKYIPRWMQGSFGRGGMVPEPLDGTFPEDNQMTNTNNRTINQQGGGPAAATMGVYSRMSPKRKRTPERADRDGDFGGENGRSGGAGGGGSENRFGQSSGGMKHRRPGGGGGGALSDRSPNTSRSNRQLGYNSENEQQDSFRGSGRNRNGSGRGNPKQNLRNKLGGGYDDDDKEDIEVDNFQRGKARLSNGQNIDPAGPSRDAMGRSIDNNNNSSGNRAGGLDSSAPLPARMNTASMERSGAAAYRCNSCGFQLTGTNQDPPFCSVSGDRHY